MRFFLLAAMLLVPDVSAAVDISIDGVSLEIPNPRGFSAVTQEMGELYELQKEFVAPTNEEFVCFVPDAVVPAARSGQIPDLSRRFSVQTAKNLIGMSVRESDFGELKNIINAQLDDILKKVERNIPGLMKRINERVADHYDTDLDLSVSQMVPLGVHEETDRTLAYSALVKYDMKNVAGNPTSVAAVATCTIVLVRGKVLFLYSFAEQTDLEWSREASREWARAVVAANPVDIRSSVNESLPNTVAGIDWGKIGLKTMAGCILGLLTGLLGWAVNRAKAS